MTCKIAEQYLTDAASAAVLDLLPESAGGDLAAVCSWADDVGFQLRWSSPLHFADTPGICNFNYSRDCHNEKGQQDMCVVGTINNYTAQLMAYGDASNSYNLTESLMFLCHFMGDVHQPLHEGFADDRGGNTIRLHWYGIATNLHPGWLWRRGVVAYFERAYRALNLPHSERSDRGLQFSKVTDFSALDSAIFHLVWDDNMIETAMKDLYNDDVDAMVEAIRLNITHGWADEVCQWRTCNDKSMTCGDKYASESVSLACDYAYKDVEQNATLGDDYFFSRLPVVEKRIAQGGVRLSELLNYIFWRGGKKEILQSVAES